MSPPVVLEAGKSIVLSIAASISAAVVDAGRYLFFSPRPPVNGALTAEAGSVPVSHTSSSGEAETTAQGTPLVRTVCVS